MTSALPSGLVVGIATFTSYLLAYQGRASTGLEQTQASTAALITLLVSALWVLAVVARPYEWWRVALVAASRPGVHVIFFSIPLAREKFMLDPSNVRADRDGAGHRTPRRPRSSRPSGGCRVGCSANAERCGARSELRATTVD